MPHYESGDYMLGRHAIVLHAILEPEITEMQNLLGKLRGVDLHQGDMQLTVKFSRIVEVPQDHQQFSIIEKILDAVGYDCTGRYLGNVTYAMGHVPAIGCKGITFKQFLKQLPDLNELLKLKQKEMKKEKTP